MDTLALVLIFIAYLAFASGRVLDWLKRRVYRRRMNRAVMLLAVLLVPYTLVTLPAARIDPGIFAKGLLAMAAYVYVPGALAIYRQRVTKPKPQPLDLADLLVILIAWLPVEFAWLPTADVTVLGIAVSVSRLTGVVLTLLIFFVLRPQIHIGYDFAFTRRDVERALKAGGVFAAVAIPVGLIARFLVWRPPAAIVAENLALQFAAIYLLVALPEELFFRGVIQNLLEKRMPQDKRTALIVVSIVFGAAHLNNPPAPNYAYALFAAGAGYVYGWVWLNTRKVTASALTHALVEWVRVVLFGG